MNPANKKAGKFYCTFKVHKEHEKNKAPPERPIVSGCENICENIGKFVEHHIKSLANTHETFLQDTPDFLREIENINEGEKLPPNAMIVTVDAIGLFTIIPQEEGVKCVEEALDERINKTVPTHFIARMLELVLKFNIFDFDSKLYKQEICTSMGSTPAPSYSDIFMARRLDQKIKNILQKYTFGNTPIYYINSIGFQTIY